MAVYTGNDINSASFKRYIGVGSSFALDVCPSKQKLEEYYGHEIKNDPQYLSTTTVNEKEVPKVRLDIILKADPAKYLDSNNKPLNLIVPMGLTLIKAPRYTKKGDKMQVIDDYGNSTYLTPEQVKNHVIPEGIKISSNYRVAYDGEVELVNFITSLLNFDFPFKKTEEGVWIWKNAEELKKCECSLEHIEDYFKGDFTELKQILSYRPNNTLRVLYGVTTKDGKTYQTVFTRRFLRENSTDYSKFERDVLGAKNNGALSNVEFAFTELHEYVVESTNFAEVNSSGDISPFEGDVVFGESPTPWP